MRAFAIERLMCDLRFPGEELKERFGLDAERVLQEAEELIAGDGDKLLERSSDDFRVTERGHPFIRTICAHFDAYFEPAVARYSLGV